MIEDALSRLSVYPFAGLTELCERGTQIIIPGNVAVKNGAIMFRHLERGMSEQMLKCKSIAAAVHQIFPGKCMTEHMRCNMLFNCSKRSVFVNHSPYCLI